MGDSIRGARSKNEIRGKEPNDEETSDCVVAQKGHRAACQVQVNPVQSPLFRVTSYTKVGAGPSIGNLGRIDQVRRKTREDVRVPY